MAYPLSSPINISAPGNIDVMLTNTVSVGSIIWNIETNVSDNLLFSTNHVASSSVLELFPDSLTAPNGSAQTPQLNLIANSNTVNLQADPTLSAIYNYNFPAAGPTGNNQGIITSGATNIFSPLVTGLRANGGTTESGGINFVNGTNVTIVDSPAGTFTFNVATGAGGVTTFQTSLSGLTPFTATSGAITLAGTLGVGSGGTGIATTPTNGQLLIGNGTNYTVATLASGTGISTTIGAGTLQVNNIGVLSINSNGGTAETGVLSLVNGSNVTIVDSPAGTFTFGVTTSSITDVTAASTYYPVFVPTSGSGTKPLDIDSLALNFIVNSGSSNSLNLGTSVALGVVGSPAVDSSGSGIVVGANANAGSGSQNVIMGNNAGSSTNTGIDNVGIGTQVLSATVSFTGSIAPSATNTGTGSGTILTMDSSTTFVTGQAIFGAGIAGGTYIVTGGTGTVFTMSSTNTFADTTIYGAQTLTVASIPVGTLVLGMNLSGSGVTAGTQAIALVSGSQSANGSTYTVNTNQTVASTTITGYSAGADNVAAGYQALQNNASSGNMGIGYQAMQNNSFSGATFVGTISPQVSGTGGTGGVLSTVLTMTSPITFVTGQAITAAGSLVGGITIVTGGTGTVFALSTYASIPNGTTIIGLPTLTFNTNSVGNFYNFSFLSLELTPMYISGAGVSANTILTAAYNGSLGSTGNVAAVNNSQTVGPVLMTMYIVNSQNTGIGFQALQNNNGLSNTAVGYQSMLSNTLGTANAAVGDGTLFSNTAGSQNTALGYQALYSNTIGTASTAIGNQALLSNTTGSGTALGAQCLKSNTTGNGNLAAGTNCLGSNTIGSSNTALGGYGALGSNTIGINNTAVGMITMLNNITGNSNTAVGNQTLLNNITGDNNTAVGSFSMQSNTIGVNNTATGYQSLISNTTGNSNTAYGYQSMLNNGLFKYSTGTASQSTTAITGTGTAWTASMVGGIIVWGVNTAQAPITAFVSTTSLTSSTSQTVSPAAVYVIYFGPSTYTTGTVTGSGTTLTGSGTTWTSAMTSAWIVFTTASGYLPVQVTTFGTATSLTVSVSQTIVAGTTYTLFYGGAGISNNTALGFQTLLNNTSTGNLTAVGYQSLFNNTSGTSNTAVGYRSLFNNTIGSSNTAFGSSALQNNTSGTNNTASGQQSLLNNTIGSSNTAFGSFALQNNTSGINNTASGQQSLLTNTIGSSNTAFGSFALQNNTSGTNNTASGQQSLLNNTTGANNTVCGAFSSQSNTVGSTNTSSGQQSLNKNTTGSNNVAVGYQALLNSGLLTYSAGTASQSTTTITGASTAWTASMVGGIIVWGANTAQAPITAFVSTTSLTSSTSQTVVSGAYAIYFGPSYTTGTVTGSGTTLTGSGTTWTSAMTSAWIVFTTASGYLPTQVTGSGFVSTTSLTVSVSQTIAAGTTYTLFYGGASGISGNTAVGTNALQLNTVASNLTAVGFGALQSSTGAQVTAVGYNALNANLGGNNNTALGYTSGNTITTGSDNTLVGNNTQAFAAASQCTVVGSSASVTGSAATTTVVGYGSTSSVATSVSIGASSSVLDTAHSLGFGLNAASVNPGSLGLTVNTLGYQLSMYTSLYATTATAGGTTVLTATSAYNQIFTGTLAQTVTLPAGPALGFTFQFVNASTSGALTINSSGGNLVTVIAAAASATLATGTRVICVLAAGTTAASWIAFV